MLELQYIYQKDYWQYIASYIFFLSFLCSKKKGEGRMALSDRLMKDPIGSVLGMAASQMNKFR